MRLLIAIAALLVTGCATTGGADMSKMDAAQLKAMVADKNFTAICTNITGTEV